MKYRVFLKPVEREDIETVKTFPTEKAYGQVKLFNTKEEAENYIIANTSSYIIREEEDDEEQKPDQQQ